MTGLQDTLHDVCMRVAELSLMMMRKGMMITTKGSTYVKALKQSQPHFTRATRECGWSSKRCVVVAPVAVFMWSLSTQLCKSILLCLIKEIKFFAPLVKYLVLLVFCSLRFQCTDSPENRSAKEHCKKAVTSKAKAATSYFQEGLELSSEELCRYFASFQTELL